MSTKATKKTAAPAKPEVKRGKGRPVSTESARQKKFAAKQAIIDAGGEIKRGRKANTESARQKKIAAYAAKIAAGIEVKRGRPKTKVETVIVEAAPKAKAKAKAKAAPVPAE